MGPNARGIGAVARTTGLSPQQIRYLERFRLLLPDRTAGDRRTYRDEHIALLRAVAAARRTGEPLASIARRLASQRSKRASAKIGELASRTGVSERRIRQLAKLGIVAAPRTDGGTRLFHESDVELVRIAATLAETTSIAALRELATGRKRFATGRESSAYIGRLLADIDSQMNARVAALREAKEDLAKAETLVASCVQCPNRPNSRDCPDCPMEQQRGASQIARIVWES